MKHNFRKLSIWIKARKLAKEIYLLTDSFPDNEKFELTSQSRRAVISVSSNIAEGSGRKGKKEFIHFLHISIGSLCELESQILVAVDLNYINKENSSLADIDEIRRMIYAFIKNLENNG